MPDAIPAPEKQMTRFEAQRKLGLFARHDYVMLVMVLLTLAVTGAYCIFGKPTLAYLLLAGEITLFWLLVWLLVLAYRVMVFVLDLHADIALLPESAARIAAGYFEGRVPQSVKK